MARAGTGVVTVIAALNLALSNFAVVFGQPDSIAVAPDPGHLMNATHDPGDPTVVTSPRLVRQVTPQFPKAASRAGITQATVAVQMMIDVTGRTAQPVVLEAKPPGLGFEAAAVKAVKKYRYEPALQGGKPVAVYFTVVVKFTHGSSEP
jgi:protein TonB